MLRGPVISAPRSFPATMSATELIAAVSDGLEADLYDGLLSTRNITQVYVL